MGTVPSIADMKVMLQGELNRLGSLIGESFTIEGVEGNDCWVRLSSENSCTCTYEIADLYRQIKGWTPAEGQQDLLAIHSRIQHLRKSAATVADLKSYFEQETGLDPTKRNAVAVMQGQSCLLRVSNKEKFISNFDARKPNHWYILCCGIQRANQTTKE